MKYTAGLFVACIILSGCGADTSSGLRSDYDQFTTHLDGSIVDQYTKDSLVDSNAEGIEGYFGQRAILSGIAEVPVLGFQETNTVGLSLVNIENDNGYLSSRIQSCQTKIQRADDIVTTLIPQAFIDSIPIYYRNGFLKDNDVQFSKLIELNGVRLSDPLTDDLPREASDPRIFDQDEDGLPGVTVFVSGLISGQINLIQRTITQLNGTFNEGSITGLIRWSIDEHILGSDQELLEMGAPITPNIDPSRSVFELIKVPLDFTCEDLIEAAPDLFDPQALILNP